MTSKNPDYKCKVSKSSGCGIGWTKDKAFSGGGEKDYYACKWTKYHTGTVENKKNADAYCDKLRKEGKECKVKRFTCGLGYMCEKSFKGPGRNAYVCVPIPPRGFTDVVVHKSKSDKKEAERKSGDANKKAK
jgi:hypothetical protein